MAIIEKKTCITFETMKEFYAPQTSCPDKCVGCDAIFLPRVESVDSGTLHLRCPNCGCEWLEHAN